MADTTKEKKKRDPDEAPAAILIDAVIEALTEDVPATEIVSALRFARGATGYKAPVWRAAAQSLTDAARRNALRDATQDTPQS